MARMSCSAYRVLWLLGLLLLLSAASSEEKACNAEEESCSASYAKGGKSSPSSTHPSPFEGFCNDVTNLYGNGGSAQAYKPNASVSSVVCRPEISQEKKYKAASWPFSRRTTRKGTAPSLEVELSINSCSSSASECSCVSLSTTPSSVIEVWQTLPNGRYSPLKSSNDDCRATVPVGKNGVASFTTVAPGSTGVMTGLGPGGFEWNPYTPPEIHLLVNIPGHTPLLLDFPALIHPKTLQQRDFSLRDWSGTAWVRKTPTQKLPFEISSWEATKEENRVSIKANIYVQQSPSSEDTASTPGFCPSWFYGLPGSFFLEPIAVCAPSMLDFLSI